MTGRRGIEGNRSERFAGRVMAVTIQKGATRVQAGWKGASTGAPVLVEIGHSQIQNRPLIILPLHRTHRLLATTIGMD